MFDTEVSLSNILISFEGVLKIEYSTDMRVSDTIDKAIQRLENTYGTTLSKDIYTLQSENQLTADNLNLLLKDIKTCLEQLSFYTSLKLFHKNVPIALADVNYIGYSRTKLILVLKYLMDDRLYEKHSDDVLTPLYNALDNINMCTIKRLFVSALMLHRLGVKEGVMCLAQLLYLGGLVE